MTSVLLKTTLKISEPCLLKKDSIGSAAHDVNRMRRLSLENPKINDVYSTTKDSGKWSSGTSCEVSSMWLHLLSLLS
jgi:hypothetical protein